MVEKFWNIMNNSTARLYGSMHFAYIKSIFRNQNLLNENFLTFVFFLYIIYREEKRVVGKGGGY